MMDYWNGVKSSSWTRTHLEFRFGPIVWLSTQDLVEKIAAHKKDEGMSIKKIRKEVNFAHNTLIR